MAAWRGVAGAARWAQDEALPEWNGCRVFAFIVGEGKIWVGDPLTVGDPKPEMGLLFGFLLLEIAL